MPKPLDGGWSEIIDALRTAATSGGVESLNEIDVAASLGRALAVCPDPSPERCELFTQISSLLSLRRIRDQVWDWLVTQAGTANPNLRSELAIGVFELLADEPVEYDSLLLLFSELERRDFQWVLEFIYRDRPQDFYRDFCFVLTLREHQERSLRDQYGNLIE